MIRAALVALLIVGCANKSGGEAVQREEDPPSPSVAAPGDAATSAPPAFEVEFRQISKHPTCLSNRRIRVDTSGAVFKAVNQTECPDGARWSTPYPGSPQRQLDAGARRRLWETIQSSGFLSLRSHYAAEAEDGTIQEIDVVIAGKPHSVIMDNTDDPAFAAVRAALIDLAP